MTMSSEERLKATAKNIEGKVQEAFGDLTGDQLRRKQGKAKQAESSVAHAKEDIKDSIKESIDEA
jgi:uncharacterized protein YjbJ (UPF0337 family)